MKNTSWINKIEYPFQSNYISHKDGNIHYVDAGNGAVILFVHGTPEWSFSYRDTIKILSKKYRCIALDHLGFGLSDKLPSADYSVKAHAERLEWFITKLELKNIVLIAGDFGGSMALSYAIKQKENVRSIILWNTWMWDVMNDTHFSIPAKTIHTMMGKFLYKRLNFPVNVIMPKAYGDKKKFTKEIHLHYKMPLNSFSNRIATYAIAKELRDAGAWWNIQWKNLKEIEQKKFLFIWGIKDKFVPPYILQIWKNRLPDAKVIELKDIGHFVHEEAYKKFASSVDQFIDSINH